jgi:hypothetical protein
MGREGLDSGGTPIETTEDPGSIPGRSTIQHQDRDMPQEDWDVLGLWIREAANSLGLRDWFFVVKHSPPDNESALASVDTVKGRSFATIRVCTDFRELTDWEQRNAIVHELLHCHFNSVHHYLFEVIPGQLGGPTSAAVMEGVMLQEEFGVDALATAICDGFPPIPWASLTPTPETSANAPASVPVD